MMIVVVVEGAPPLKVKQLVLLSKEASFMVVQTSSLKVKQVVLLFTCGSGNSRGLVGHSRQRLQN